ncbi:MAG TPA: SAM-dependent chlorinase/fluorinase [Gemmatimonadaceae bacterium]|nr:SAM-dependent chlorinase/fluorinase [Gemmatimonadaceae bacterium]
MARIITLLTDFGTADGYVGEMKGVILSAVPDAMIIDISHALAPQDVDAARLTLARVWRRFPRGTIHVVVVDPGVGSERVALAVESDGRLLVGPDNGVLSPALLSPGARTVALAVPPDAAPTFHGRDVFAPAAAALARGRSVDSLGSPYAGAIIRRTPEPHRVESGHIAGEVILIDRFGNAVTNLVGRRDMIVEVGGVELPMHRTYADAEPGQAMALVGSAGLIEIAVRDGSAAAELQLVRGARILTRHAYETVRAR